MFKSFHFRSNLEFKVVAIRIIFTAWICQLILSIIVCHADDDEGSFSEDLRSRDKTYQTSYCDVRRNYMHRIKSKNIEL